MPCLYFERFAIKKTKTTKLLCTRSLLLLSVKKGGFEYVGGEAAESSFKAEMKKCLGKTQRRAAFFPLQDRRVKGENTQ